MATSTPTKLQLQLVYNPDDLFQLAHMCGDHFQLATPQCVGVAFGRGPMVAFKFWRLICTVQANGAKAGGRCREFGGGRF